MSAFLSFFKLIRWPNILFIALTQCLFYYCIAVPVTELVQHVSREQSILFYILCISSVLIAAAGYIINDYFDLNIDLVNKPDRMVVDRQISRRWAIFFHFVFSMTGILLGFYIGLQNGNWLIGLSNIFAVLLLWFYSTVYKKRLLTGNLLISLLTAWTIGVVYVHVAYYHSGDRFHQVPVELSQKFIRLTLLYASFAFIITLVREIVKDLEDMEGDRKYGCRTMPIIWGVDFSKIFAQVWLLILTVLLIIVLLYILQYRMWVPAVYNLFILILPSLLLLQRMRRSGTVADFARLSNWIKSLMLAGILSMVLFKFFG
jgi:4-hydroxybenzoate polyprenyltransferase